MLHLFEASGFSKKIESALLDLFGLVWQVKLVNTFICKI